MGGEHEHELDDVVRYNGYIKIVFDVRRDFVVKKADCGRFFEVYKEFFESKFIGK